MILFRWWTLIYHRTTKIHAFNPIMNSLKHWQKDLMEKSYSLRNAQPIPNSLCLLLTKYLHFKWHKKMQKLNLRQSCMKCLGSLIWIAIIKIKSMQTRLMMKWWKSQVHKATKVLFHKEKVQKMNFNNLLVKGKSMACSDIFWTRYNSLVSCSILT